MNTSDPRAHLPLGGSRYAIAMRALIASPAGNRRRRAVPVRLHVQQPPEPRRWKLPMGGRVYVIVKFNNGTTRFARDVTAGVQTSHRAGRYTSRQPSPHPAPGQQRVRQGL